MVPEYVAVFFRQRHKVIVLRGDEDTATARDRRVDKGDLQIRFPQLFAARGVQGEDTSESGAHKNFACVEGDAAAEAFRRIDRHIRAEQTEDVEIIVGTLRSKTHVPHPVARARIERKNMGLRVEHIKASVHDDRRSRQPRIVVGSLANSATAASV